MYLGIDVGTSAVKALIAGEDGRIVAQASEPLEVCGPRTGWSEQNPEDWWRASVAAVRRLPARSRRAVRTVGLCGQMHGATLLGRGDEVLRPAILWNDGRSAPQCVQLEQIEPRLRSITGNAAMPGFTAPKILWVREHEPDVYARIAHVLLPKDYVRLRLTGEYFTDPSDASGTLWLDVARRSWSAALLAATGLDERAMPAVIEGPSITANLTAAAAGALGLPRVPVVAGGGDNAASAVGLGVQREGDAFLSLGTSGVLFVVTDQFRPNPDRAAHAFCHCLPGLWHQMAVLLSAGSALKWAVAVAGYDHFDAAIREAQQRGLHAATPLFLPYLSGERTPHNDVRARGVYFGLGTSTVRADLVAAAMAGVALAFADGLAVLREAGSRLRGVTLCGGGARIDWWGQMLATVLDLPLTRASRSEAGAALGAALLARLGDGGEPPAAPAPEMTFTPDAALAAWFAGRRALYRRLYSDLRHSFTELPA
jgi:xylulokinase